MEFLVQNKKHSFDLMDSYEREEAQQFFSFRNIERVPFLNSLLLINAKIKGYDDLTEEELKLRIGQGDMVSESLDDIINANAAGSQSETNMGFTFFNPLDNFFNIYINWQAIEANHRANPEFVSFLLLHQVCHSYFGHFTRPVINQYRSKKRELTEVILDAQINTFMIKALNYKGSSNLYDKQTYNYVQSTFATYEKLFTFVEAEYGIKADFDIANDYPPIEHVFKLLDKLFDGDPVGNSGQSLSEALGAGAMGAGMDNHAASSQQTENQAQQLGKSLDDLGQMQGDSMEYLQETAKQEGVGMSSAFERQSKSEYAKKSVLEIIKLKKILGYISRTHFKKTWKRTNRRREYADGMPMKGKMPDGGHHLVVGLDVSGSVSDEEVNMVKSHLKTFAKKNKESVILDFFVWSSGEVKAERDLLRNISDARLDEFKPYSYGGTQLEYVNDFIKKEYEKEQIVFVNITDGYYSRYQMPTDIITSHYGVLTIEGQEDKYKSMHKGDNLTDTVTIRAERRGF